MMQWRKAPKQRLFFFFFFLMQSRNHVLNFILWQQRIQENHRCIVEAAQSQITTCQMSDRPPPGPSTSIPTTHTCLFFVEVCIFFERLFSCNNRKWVSVIQRFSAAGFFVAVQTTRSWTTIIWSCPCALIIASFIFMNQLPNVVIVRRRTVPCFESAGHLRLLFLDFGKDPGQFVWAPSEWTKLNWPSGGNMFEFAVAPPNQYARSVFKIWNV